MAGFIFKKTDYPFTDYGLGATLKMWPNRHQLHLLKAAVLPPDSAIRYWIKWERVYQNRYEHIDYASAGLVSLALRNLEKQLVRTPFVKRCEGLYRQNWTYNQLLWKGLKPVFSYLNDAGISYTLLKGMYMIQHEYNDFGVRRIGDVDILIDSADFSSIHGALRQLGFQPLFSEPITTGSLPGSRHAVAFKKGTSLIIDVHVRLSKRFIADISPSTLSIEMRLLHTMIHGLKPSVNPVIRWIPDAVTLIRNHSIDWDLFRELAIATRTSYQLYKALVYLNRKFDVSIPKSVFPLLLSQTHYLEPIEYWLYRTFPFIGTTVPAEWIRLRLNESDNRISFFAYVHKHYGWTPLQVFSRLMTRLLKIRKV